MSTAEPGPGGDPRPIPLDDATQALVFLRTLFGEKPDDWFVVLWELGNKTSRSYADLGEAARWAAGRDDLFVHVALSRVPVNGNRRLTAETASGIVGVWGDVDVAGPFRKKAGLPPDAAAAERLIAEAGLPATVVVHSGGGDQLWSLLAEPWLFEDDVDRRRAGTLVRAWDLSLRERARRLGWNLDAVGDLARVLRLPGTRNTKYTPPAEVQLGAIDPSRRVSVDDIEAALLEGTWQQAERDVIARVVPGEGVASYGALTLDPDAEPPWAKLDALRELEPRFDQSWRRAQTKRTLGWSASEYDFSLVSYAVMAGWSDQEIANLLITARRKHHDEPKIRQDYFALTIGKARGKHDTAAREARLLEALEEPPPEPSLAKPEPETEEAPTDRLQIVSDLIKVKVLRFVQLRSDPAQYRLKTEAGEVALGDAGAVLSLQKFRAAVFSATQRVIPRFKDREWDRVVQALGDACIIEDIGTEATEAGQASTWIAAYLNLHSPIEDIPASMSGNHAFLRDGATFVWGERLQQFLANSSFDRVTAKQMGAGLRVYGALPARIHMRKADGSRTTRSAWQLPPNIEGGDDDTSVSELSSLTRGNTRPG